MSIINEIEKLKHDSERIKAQMRKLVERDLDNLPADIKLLLNVEKMKMRVLKKS